MIEQKDPLFLFIMKKEGCMSKRHLNECKGLLITSICIKRVRKSAMLPQMMMSICSNILSSLDLSANNEEEQKETIDRD